MAVSSPAGRSSPHDPPPPGRPSPVPHHSMALSSPAGRSSPHDPPPPGRPSSPSSSPADQPPLSPPPADPPLLSPPPADPGNHPIQGTVRSGVGSLVDLHHPHVATHVPRKTILVGLSPASLPLLTSFSDESGHTAAGITRFTSKMRRCISDLRLHHSNLRSLRCLRPRLPPPPDPARSCDEATVCYVVVKALPLPKIWPPSSFWMIRFVAISPWRTLFAANFLSSGFGRSYLLQSFFAPCVAAYICAPVWMEGSRDPGLGVQSGPRMNWIAKEASWERLLQRVYALTTVSSLKSCVYSEPSRFCFYCSQMGMSSTFLKDLAPSFLPAER